MPQTGYSIGGAALAPGADGVTVYLNQHPIPTAQITIFIFKDTQPINNAPDATEQGLAGFTIIVEDAGGRYGASAGVQSQDASAIRWGPRTMRRATRSVRAPHHRCHRPDDHQEPGARQVWHPGGAAGGSSWQQTATIEGTKVIDAWVKANEPAFFAEFGPPGYHVFIGFVQPFNNILPAASATTSGDVVNNHLSRPHTPAAHSTGGPFDHTTPWVGLNHQRRPGRPEQPHRRGPDG